jgi:endonuclease/exonuclease/phosphatase family metal-dependent hydrolase
VRLVTFNVLHGASPDDGVVDLERFAAAVTALDPDVLALQEVDRGQERSHHADLADVAAEAMGAADRRFCPAMLVDTTGRWRPTPRRPAPDAEAYGGAAYGVALVSRHPVSGWRDLRLPRIVPPFPLLRRDPRRLEIRHEERRAAVVARVETPEGALLVASAHLSFVPGWAQLQLYALRRSLAGEPGPALIMGDLNMTPPPARRFSGFRSLAAAPTFPFDEPVRQIDHVLARGDVGDVVAVRAPRLAVSDHRALVVDLDRARLRRDAG